MRVRPQRLIISSILSDQLYAALHQTPDEEKCGLLIGSGYRDVLVDAIVAVANVAPEPTHRFEIDPQVQFDLLKRLRGTEQRIVGHFHSHPNGPAAPSAYDLAMAHDPDAIWLIAALRPKEQLAAYACTDQNQGFEPIIIVPSPLPAGSLSEG